MSNASVNPVASSNQQNSQTRSSILIEQCYQLGPREAAELLATETQQTAAEVLSSVLPTVAHAILKKMDTTQRQQVLSAAPAERVKQWTIDEQYPDNSIGRLMEPPVAVFSPSLTVAETTEKLRELVKRTFITYGFVVDEKDKLVGVITMRDLLFNETTKRLSEIMLKDVFALNANTELVEAMRATLNRHFPVYPVIDGDNRLVGLIRGQTMFEQQAIELSAQAGSMVGVEKEERLATPWQRSFLFRHPWLQLNLLTAFVAAAVVGVFEKTIDQIVVLAVFLPVLAGQSGNTGCQALAVALRAMTLGELKPGKGSVMVMKEGILGLANGALVGLTAGIGMYIFATIQKNPDALILSVVVFLAMIASCVISGVSGALVPQVLKKLGADPATASSIFLTTATDVVSMGTFLGLATWLIL